MKRTRVRGYVMLAALVLSLNAIAPVGHSTFSARTSNPVDAFAAAASFCTTLSPVWLTGFEAGVASSSGAAVTPAASLLNTVSGTVSADDAVTRSGNYALRIAKAGGAGHYVAKSDLGAGGVVTMRLAIRFETLPVADQTELLRIDISSGGDLLLGYSNTAPKRFTVGYAGGATQSGPAAGVETGRWYRIDLQVDVSSGTHVVNWRVDGVAQTSATIAEPADTFAGSISLGSTVSSDAFIAYYEDVLVTLSAASYPLPDGNILSLGPNQFVTENNPLDYFHETDGTTDLSNNSARLLHDERMTSTTSFVRQDTGSATDYWAEFGFEDVTRSGCVSGVSAVVALHAAGTTANSVRTAIWDSGTERIIHSGDSVATAALQYRSAVIQPASGVWDATKLSAVTTRLGYFRAGGSEPFWDALRLEYDQVPNATSQYASTVLADNPASYWRLGDASTSSTATDTTGAVSGTYTNGPLRKTSGAVGDTDAGTTFDGVNDFVSMGDVYDFNGLAAFTAEAWIRPTTTAANYNMGVVSKWADTNTGWALTLSPATYPVPRAGDVVRSNGTSAVEYYAGTTLRSDRWYHLVQTYDGSRLRLYINGALAIDVAAAFALPDGVNSLSIGVLAQSMLIDLFRGTIDEVAMYTTALSAARVLAHYNAGKP